MSDDELPSIPVSLIKQYHYCPRIVYFSHVLGVREKSTESMRRGVEAQSSEERKDRRRKRPVPEVEGNARLHQLSLSSLQLGIEGAVDLLMEGEGLVVVERKYAEAPKKPPRGHIYQAAAYAMLVERCLGKPVRFVFLIYLKSKKRFKVELDDAIRRHVIWTIGQIREIIEDGVIPPYKPVRGCSSCGYLWICQRV